MSNTNSPSHVSDTADASRPVYSASIVGELAEMAAKMVAARYRRTHPGSTDAEVDAVVRAWWQDRPGAHYGDAVGIPRPVPAALQESTRP